MMANYVQFILTAFFYGPLYPIAFWWAFCGTLLNWFVYRVIIVTSKKRPTVINETIIAMFYNKLTYVLVLWCVAYCNLIDNI